MKWPWSRRERVEFSWEPVNTLVTAGHLFPPNGIPAIGRIEALSVPAVQRGRNMICSIATLPLRQLDANNITHRSPLLEQLDPDVPNVVTLAMTLEDLLFDSIAWWLVIERDFTGFPVSVRHIPTNRVSVQPPIDPPPSPLPSGIDPRYGVVYVNGTPVSERDIIRFDSPNPALLQVGMRAIRRAITLDQAANMYADNPRPLDFFTPADGADPASDDDIATMLRQWEAARKSHSTAYIPAALKYNSVDTPSPSDLQLVELQKQVTLEIANAIGVDPEDLGVSTTSRTYQNAVDRRQDRVNTVLAPFMSVITERLSMGDVTRRGYRVVFDLDDYLKPNPTERWSIYETAKGLGAITVEEIRENENMPPIPIGAAAEAEAPALPRGEVIDIPVEASRPASHTFDSPPRLTFADLQLTTFSVDKETRVIEGVALPYNQVAGQGFRFAPGAMQWDTESPGKVKLLREHDAKNPLGKAIQLKDTPDGLLVRFKVARGAAGDEALELAEDGVLDGLSVGVDFDARKDAGPDPENKGAVLVHRSVLREVSLTAMPDFDNARVTTVAASRTQGGQMPDVTTEPTAAPDTPTDAPAEPVEATFTAAQWQTMLTGLQPEPVDEGPTPVSATRTLTLSNVREAAPYRFSREGKLLQGPQYDFSTDLVSMLKAGDMEGTQTDAGRRAMGFLQATFAATTVTTDVNELNPNIQRPDLWVGMRPYESPLWNAVNNGSPPNGVQPFTFPKLDTSTIAVTGHTEGVEPPRGNVITTSQTVSPTSISGKSSITREVWDMGGNPAVSGVIFDEMIRSWTEGLESATATFLATLTAATDINLGVAVVDDALADAWDSALIDLQFVRKYDWSVFAVEKWLYRALGTAEDTTGRRLFPMIGPMNANGTVQRRFTTLDLGGVVAIPTWALTAVSGSANNSWLFDPAYVHGWATAPQRLEFPGTNSTGGYAPVAMIDLAVWGYVAHACRDIGAVRQVIYDNAA